MIKRRKKKINNKAKEIEKRKKAISSLQEITVSQKSREEF